MKLPQIPRNHIFITLAAIILVVGAASFLLLKPHSSPSGATSSQAAKSTAPTSSSAGAVKPYITGIMSRSGPPDTAQLSYQSSPLVGAFVVQVNWQDVQPSGPNDFVTTAIDSQLAFAEQHNLPVRFRVYAGAHSPSWALSQAGSVAWSGTPNDGGPDNYQIPEFWKPPFQALWQTFNQKLSAKYDANPLVREVVPGLCATYFNEPFIRQFSVAQNITTAAANGYTDELDMACLRTSLDDMKTTWPTTNVDMTLNPFQSISKSKTDVISQPTAIAQYCRQQLGQRCVLGNNSLKSGSRGSDYAALYDMMHATGAPIYIQTSTNAKIGDWQDTLTQAVSIGALSVELPAGYQSYDPAALQSYNAKLAGNVGRTIKQ